MNKFTIRDVENLCGIKAHTLRVWEQRYQLCVARRKESLHRIYDDEDLKELLRVSFLYHNGYKISQIAELTPEQVKAEVAKIEAVEKNYDAFLHQMVEASIDFDTERFERIIDSLVLRFGIDKCMLHIFCPFLQRIGLLWMTNHVVPAHEHFASNIIRQKIICATDGLEPVKNRNNTVVFFTPPGEEHEIPLLLANYFFRSNGVHTIYLGINVAMDVLIDFTSANHVTHFYTHIITHLDSLGLDDFMRGMCHDFPKQTLLISGPACKCVAKNHCNMTHFCTPQDAILYAQKLG